MDNMRSELIAPCGMNCKLCMAFQHTHATARQQGQVAGVPWAIYKRFKIKKGIL